MFLKQQINITKKFKEFNKPSNIMLFYSDLPTVCCLIIKDSLLRNLDIFMFIICDPNS